MGVVYDPSRKELFFAEKGKGAYLNGKPLQPSRQKDFKGALVITGFYYDRGEKMRETLKQVEYMFTQGIIGLRRLGSAALDISYVAAGRADLFWEYELAPWDYGAAQLILQEAGGKISDYQGEDLDLRKTSVVAGNSYLYKKFLAMFNDEKL